MADDKQNEQDLEQQDAAFRQQMRDSDDPQARRWRQFDNSARAQEDQLGELDGVAKLYAGLTQARGERDSFREDNERTDINAAQWDEQYQALDQNAVDHQQKFQEGLKGANLDDIEALQADIQRRQDELEQTIAARQGIALLPSEEAAQAAGQAEQQGEARGAVAEAEAQALPGQEQDEGVERARQEEDQRREQGVVEDDERKRRREEEDRLQEGEVDAPQHEAEQQEVSMATIDDWRARHDQEQAADDAQEQGQQGSQDLGQGPGGLHWRAYATTAEEAAENRQLEEDQNQLAHELGRQATSEEIDAYQQERNQGQDQGQDAEHNQVEEDLAHESQTEGMRTGMARTNDNQHNEQDQQEQGQAQGELEVNIPDLGAARQNRQAKQAQQEEGPQPNSTYAQRQAAAKEAEEGTQQQEGEVVQHVQQHQRVQRRSQGMGM